MFEYVKKLQNINEAYMKATVSNQFEDDEIPTGEYDCLIEKINLKEGKNGLQLSWQFRIKAPTYINRCHFMTTPLEGEFLGITKSWLNNLGYILKSTTEIPRTISEIVARNFMIKLFITTNKKGYPVSYFKSIISPTDAIYSKLDVEKIKEGHEMSDRLLTIEDQLRTEQEIIIDPFVVDNMENKNSVINNPENVDKMIEDNIPF